MITDFAPASTTVRRRTVLLLASAQAMSGLAAGSVVSVGSLLAVQMSGSRAWAGSVTTASTLGAALAALLLARTALLHGRRVALTSGLAVASVGALGIVLAGVLASLPLLLVGGALMGVGSAVNLQARFAATDLSTVATRSRDLSLVVWTGTVGAVVGPNLVRFGEPASRMFGIPALPAVFIFSAAGMAVALAIVWIGLRPDPLILARGPATARPEPPARGLAIGASLRMLRRYPAAGSAAMGVIVAHAAMVAVMAMTPVHLDGHGASIEFVGLAVSLHVAGMFALAPVFGTIADRVGARRVLLGGLALLVVAVAVCGIGARRNDAVTAGLVLLGVAWSAVTVSGSSIVAGAVPGDGKVMVQGLTDALMSLAGAGGGALAGVLLAVGGYDGLTLVVGLLVVAGSVVVLRAGRSGALGRGIEGPE